jgi:prepilin-type N-terminal cleavage/methylation domain-containing protein
MTAYRSPRKGVSRGYSIIELLISMAILVVLTGAIFAQIDHMQKKSASEAMKLDIGQEAREFVDQTVRDLHMAGYPNVTMYAPPVSDVTKVAAGLVSVSPTSILMEGDVNNDGNVYSVNIYYVPSDVNDPNCPCVRRSAVIKVATDSLSQPTASSYTEAQNVVPPGTGPGQSGEDLFSFYDQNGNPVTAVGTGADISTASGQAAIDSISTVKINLTILSNLRDPATGGLMGTSMSGTAKVGH